MKSEPWDTIEIDLVKRMHKLMSVRRIAEHNLFKDRRSANSIEKMLFYLKNRQKVLLKRRKRYQAAVEARTGRFQAE